MNLPENRAPEPLTPIITRCAAVRGWLWWLESFRLVREAIGSWYGIGVGYLGIFIIPSVLISMLGADAPQISFIGYLPTVFAPCFTVGFVAAGWSQARGEVPQFFHLFRGFKADVKTLMGIGAVTAVLMWLSAKIGAMALGSDFASMTDNLDKQDPMAILTFLISPRLWLAGLVYMTLVALIWMSAWLAPMVVVFQHTHVAPAMLSSLRAIFVNWRALAVYALVPIVGAFAFSLALGLVMTFFSLLIMSSAGSGSTSILQVLVWALLLPLIPLLISVGTLTSFVAYCDIFHAKDAVFPRPPPQRAP